MGRDRSKPEDGDLNDAPSPERADSVPAQVVDWFGLSESNLPADAGTPSAPEAATPQDPGLGSVGGLRP